MILEHQDALVAEIFDEALALFLAHRHPLEIMVGELAGEVAGVEVHGLEPALERAERDRRGGGRVDGRGGGGQDAVEQDGLDKASRGDVARTEDGRVGKERGCTGRTRGWQE